MNHLPNTTKLTIYQLLLGGKFKYFFGLVFLFITKYKINTCSQNSKEIVFIINYEKTARYDHIDHFKYIYDSTNTALGYHVSYFEIKRVLNWNILELINSLIKKKSFFKIINDQMSEILKAIHDSEIKKVVLFCDTVPLQNYICDFYNKINIETYSLQHGFYIPDDNKIFELVYKASNSKNFFVWDRRTLKYMLKHKGGQCRNFIKAGPFSKSVYSNSIIKRNKNSYIKNIAIYGCGKDQVSQNKYLVSLYKYLKMNTGFKIFLITHPLIKPLSRLRMSINHKVFFRTNKLKSNQYDLHLVLNSGVWLELEEQGERYYLLNDLYTKDVSHKRAYKKIFSPSLPSSREHVLSPFYKDLDSIEIIVKNIIDLAKNKKEQ